jgi:hypothetical protein
LTEETKQAPQPRQGSISPRPEGTPVLPLDLAPTAPGARQAGNLLARVAPPAPPLPGAAPPFAPPGVVEQVLEIFGGSVIAIERPKRYQCPRLHWQGNDYPPQGKCRFCSAAVVEY